MKSKKSRVILIVLLLTALLGLAACTAAAAGGETPSAPAPTPAVTPEAAPSDAAPAPEPELRTVDAATVDELLKAIGPNTVINLTGRSYDLTEAQGYGIYGSRYYGWNEIYDDGWELELNHVEGLTIQAGRSGVEIVTVPRYANVLKLVGCRDVTLKGFTAGHTDGAGYCTGAVFHLEDCRDVQVEDCDLYGCGTYGLEIERSHGVHARGTVIRDCSYGAIYVSSSTDILLDDCSIHGIQGFGGLFSYNSCRDCAVINTMVRSCTSGSLVELNSSKNVYMAGCEISRNVFDGMFSCTVWPLVAEGCSFRNNSTGCGWYLDTWRVSERVVDPAGNEYRDEDLETLTLMRDVSWTAPEEAELVLQAPEVSEDGMIHVHTVDELLAAIGPNVSIRLEDGVYDLSTASGYGMGSGEYWYWMGCYDGPGLVIRGVENLSISAAGSHRTRVAAAPRYCEVLSFEDCRGVTLSGFTAGHTQSLEDYACAGGVLEFSDCSAVTVEDCSLYGCGVMGVTCMSCRDVSVRYTEIHDCSYGAVYLYGSTGVAVDSCNIHDIPGPIFQVYDCKDITADGRTIPEGESR